MGGIELNSLENDSKRVLIVDDNDINRELMCEIMKIKGLKPDCAANGLEAVELFRAYPYPLIFMDCQMPVMNGYEASKKIREIENGEVKTRIIALTGGSVDEDKEKCLEAGMDDFLAKPIDINTVFKFI